MDSERTKAAAGYLSQGYNGAQSVLLSFSGDYGMDEKCIKAVSEGFGGGMKTADTCSAVTGAIMAIGLMNADISNARERKEKTAEMVKRFKRIFAQKHGSTECRFLLGTDISTPNGHKNAYDAGIFEKFCPGYVEDAVRILETINEK